MKIIKSIVISIFRLAYFLPVLALVILWVILIGHPILGPGLPGSDNANFINLASWLSKWFPRIPFWYPQEGGGISFTISYPILNQLLIVIFEKIFDKPLAVVFRVWSLITVVLSSVGLFLLTYRLTRNQTISALAAIFYPLAPITWILLVSWGFAAEQLSYWYVPIILIFFSLFMDEFYSNGFSFKTRIYLLIFSVFFALLPLAHPLVFVGLLMFIGILLFVYPIMNFKNTTVKTNKIWLFGIGVIITILLLTTFWIYPFLRYQKFVAQGAPVAKVETNFNFYMQYAIYAPNLFNVTDKTASYKKFDDPPQYLTISSWRNVAFPFIICVLAIIGLIGSLFLNRKVFAFGLANLVPLIISVTPQITYHLMWIPFSGYLFNWRASLLASRFIIPLLAAFGCYTISYLFVFPINLLSKKIKSGLLKNSVRLIFIFSSAILTLVVATALLWKFRSWPSTYPDFLLSYGRDVLAPSERLDLRNVWRRENDYCFGGGILLSREEFPLCYNFTLQKYFWPYKLYNACLQAKDNLVGNMSGICDSDPSPASVKEAVRVCDSGEGGQYPEICAAKTASFLGQIQPSDWLTMLKSKDLFGNGKEIFGDREIFKKLPKDTNNRVDTNLGGYMMVEPFYSDMPELPVYYNQSSLMKTLWNYQMNVFRGEEVAWPQDSVMYELSKYFGLGYFIMYEAEASVDKMQRIGWERVESPVKEGGLALWKFKEAVGLLRVTTNPTILVIGQDKVDGYFRAFHLANLGVVPFEEGLIVKGGPNVDTFSAKELLKFDTVILEGYTYKNQSKAWKILDEYVKEGGTLLINTGWQYSSVDWEVPNTPEFMPLKELKWLDPGRVENYTLEDNQIGEDVDVAKFSPLIYDNNNWNISSSDDKSALRDWAKVILSANGKPLVAGGKYGNGKVMWMGLDIPGHIGTYENNTEEIKLYKNLFTYLLEGKKGKILEANFTRDYPDKLIINLNEASDQKTAVYFSEAFYPDFRATLVTDNENESIKAYKAGPGMTMFTLPNVKAGSKIIYEYKTPILITISRVVSVLTLIILIISVVLPKYFDKFIKKHGEKVQKNLDISRNEDENY